MSSLRAGTLILGFARVSSRQSRDLRAGEAGEKNGAAPLARKSWLRRQDTRAKPKQREPDRRLGSESQGEFLRDLYGTQKSMRAHESLRPKESKTFFNYITSGLPLIRRHIFVFYSDTAPSR